jgi:malate dehydrogenase
MREVAIIGAGELGGALAHALARLDVTRSIRIIDESGRVAEGKALDIAQAAPVEQFATKLSAAADVSYAATAELILLADHLGQGERRADDAFVLLRRLALTSRAPIICAGVDTVAIVERGVSELKIPRARLIGTAPEALAAAARALVALAVNGSPRDVALSLLGRPPAHTIVSWNDATFAGSALTRLLDEPHRRRLDARIAALWPPGPMALAAAAAKAVTCIDGRTRQLVSCFIGPDTSAGVRTRTAALPVRLGSNGIVDVVMPMLSRAEQVALDNAVLI